MISFALNLPKTSSVIPTIIIILPSWLPMRTIIADLTFAFVNENNKEISFPTSSSDHNQNNSISTSDCYLNSLRKDMLTALGVLP